MISSKHILKAFVRKSMKYCLNYAFESCGYPKKVRLVTSYCLGDGKLTKCYVSP